MDLIIVLIKVSMQNYSVPLAAAYGTGFHSFPFEGIFIFLSSNLYILNFKFYFSKLLCTLGLTSKIAM